MPWKPNQSGKGYYWMPSEPPADGKAYSRKNGEWVESSTGEQGLPGEPGYIIEERVFIYIQRLLEANDLLVFTPEELDV